MIDIDSLLEARKRLNVEIDRIKKTGFIEDGSSKSVRYTKNQIQWAESKISKLLLTINALHREIQKTKETLELRQFVIQQTYENRRKDANYEISKPMIREMVFSKDGRKCVQCGNKQKLTIDHILPVKLGGDNSLTNLQTLCKSCNSKKGANYDQF